MSEAPVSEEALNGGHAKAKTQNSQALRRKALKKQTTIDVPALDLTKRNALFRKITFAECPLAVPGDKLLDASGTGHNAPHPQLLAARSVNCVINYLVGENKVGDFQPPNKDAPSLLFLSCRDVTDNKSECEFCFSSESDDDLDDGDGNSSLAVKALATVHPLRCTHDSDLSSSATAPHL
eukprot:3012787-Rhodomonas_salina.1